MAVDDVMQLIRRPHFKSRDGEIYFLNARRPLLPLSLEAHALFEVAAAPVTLARDMAVGAQELVDRGLVDVIAPVTDLGRRRILVLEPHGDDAALSIGGTMWNMRHQAEFTLITLASRSNYTSSFHTGRDFFVRDIVSDLRRREGEIYMAYLGGRYNVLDLNEATLRYADQDWSVDFFRAHRASVAANNNRQASDAVLDCWKVAIETLMADPQFAEIWIPLGAGSHSDHDLTRNAALRALIAHPEVLDRAAVRFYKDVPYGTDFPEHTDRILNQLRKAGAVIASDTRDITDSLDTKLQRLGIFASQFKVGHVRGGVVRSAAVGADAGRAVEHLWAMTRLPDRLDTFALFHAAPQVADVADWTNKSSKARTLHVLALGAAGHWRRDLPLLRTRFPQAQIIVHATRATRAEFMLSDDENVVVQDIDSGLAAWAKLALSLVLISPSHILFIAGDRTHVASRLAHLWPHHRVLVVEAMDHAMLAVQRDTPTTEVM